MSTIPAKDDEVFCFERKPFNNVRAVIDEHHGSVPLFFSHDITEALRVTTPRFKLNDICQQP